MGKDCRIRGEKKGKKKKMRRKKRREKRRKKRKKKRKKKNRKDVEAREYEKGEERNNEEKQVVMCMTRHRYCYSETFLRVNVKNFKMRCCYLSIGESD